MIENSNNGEHELDRLARYIKRKLGEERVPTTAPRESIKEDQTKEQPTATPPAIRKADRDLGTMTELIQNVERLYDAGKLSKRHVDSYQKKLDKFAQQYQDDESLGSARSVLYEMQALLLKAQGENEAAHQCLVAGATFMSYGDKFISKAVNSWLENELNAQLEEQRRWQAQKAQTQRKHKRKKAILIVCALGLIIAISSLAGPIGDYLTIKDANPVMVKLAKDAGMSRDGELLFLRAHPQLDSAAQFPNDCPTASSNSIGSSVLGCYQPSTNRIYILSMPSNLYNEEVTTAAYEMLHPVYIALSQTDSANLNVAIEANFNSISSDSSSCTDDIPSQVTGFAKTEPGARDNELFSLLGTECNNLSTSLAAYYAPYFTDLSINVSDNQQIDNLFQNDENQLNQLQSTINQWESKATTDFNNTESWNGVNESEFDYDHNIYSDDINDENAAINEYNAQLQEINTLVTAITGGQPVNQIQNVQSNLNKLSRFR